MSTVMKRILLESAVIAASMVAGQMAEHRSVRPHTEQPRREPVEPKPQREPPKQLTDADHARIQAAADRRAKRNAKRAAQAGSGE